MDSFVECRKRVFVSGCFDLLHCGHVRFLQKAAEFGDLFVSVGSDETVRRLKGRPPVYSEQERLYLVKALACVREAAVARGVGLLDFEEDLRTLRPDFFVVNEDGDSPKKQELCVRLEVEYVVLHREPPGELPARSTTALRAGAGIPYRIDLAGGWLDQPFVSMHVAGPVIVMSVMPDRAFACGSGMATSTRKMAEELWGTALPPGNPEKHARILFACENPPGKKEISGSQDALGIVLPGVSRLHYGGEYWPRRIDSVCDEAILAWLDERVYLKPLGPRPKGFRVLGRMLVTPDKARKLAEAAEACWEAVLCRDSRALGRAVHQSFSAQVSMFPRMVTPRIQALAREFCGRSLGVKLCGAGGGGYLAILSEEPIDHCLRIHIRRPSVGGEGEAGLGQTVSR